MNSDSLTGLLKEHALSHGVNLIGITSAKPFIKRDRTETKIDPKELLADARSVIVTAFYMNEVVDAPLIDKDNPKGRFTHAYSIRAFTPMANHYVEIIKGFLERQGYQAVSNKKYRIPDKMAAARAGIGKYGKNSVIITREFGSYVMFVTLITNAPLEYEENKLDVSGCGNCEICLRACHLSAL